MDDFTAPLRRLYAAAVEARRAFEQGRCWREAEQPCHTDGNLNRRALDEEDPGRRAQPHTRADEDLSKIGAAAEQVSPVPRPGDWVRDRATGGYGRVQVLLGTGDVASILPDGQDDAVEVPTRRLAVVVASDREMFLQARRPQAADAAGNSNQADGAEADDVSEM